MKKHTFKFFLILFNIPMMIHCDAENIKPAKNDYFGQNPPGLKPEKFAPGIISADEYEQNGIFTPVSLPTELI